MSEILIIRDYRPVKAKQLEAIHKILADSDVKPRQATFTISRWLRSRKKGFSPTQKAKARLGLGSRKR